MSCDWVCYFICTKDKKRTYIGITNNLTKRLRQHNGEIGGGAKATRGKKWDLVCYVKGFPRPRETRQFEWKMHHRRARGFEQRKQALSDVLSMERFTSKCIPTCEMPNLEIVWSEEIE